MLAPQVIGRLPLSFTLAVLVCIGALVFSLTMGSRYLVWDRGKGLSLPRWKKETKIQLDDLKALAVAMSGGSAPIRFAVIMFNTPDRPSEDDVLNIQMSVENGRLGFEWVLLAPRNIEDQEKFRAFARARGLKPLDRSMNGVSYIRVETMDVARFTANVATEMYHHPSQAPLGLIHEGFAWPPN